MASVALAGVACKGGPSDAQVDASDGVQDGGNNPIVDGAVPDSMVDGSLPDAMTGVPTFFTARNDLSDDQLADQALALLTDTQIGNCTDCHGITKQRLYQWRALSDQSLSTCLTDLTVPNQAVAKEMLDCLRVDSSNPSSFFDASSSAIFSTGAHLAWFKYTFQIAYGANYLAP
ncbi:MAG: hypothetical protein JKY56_16105 [Kofleriaceae bacterium]|nr:hypothetical protein [Kofleriaceae bacterium]